MAAQKYRKMDPREHVLARPGMYIGSIEEDTTSTWVFDDETQTIVKKNIKYVPGLYKIFDEILVNALDHVTRLKMSKEENINYVKNIKVLIDKSTGIITVTNDGDGIDIERHPEHNIYIPELIFGNLLTSVNYDDSEDKIIGGQNGIGAKACNIFSTFFSITTVDSKRKKIYTQEFSDNMSKKTEPIIRSYSKKPFTSISFKPDYMRFKYSGITHDMYSLLAKRSHDACALTENEVNVYFNEKKLDYKNFEKYVDLYLGNKADHVRTHDIISDRWEIVATYNESGTFEHVSFVNGISTIRGGKHVDYIVNQLCTKLADLVNKKRKDVDVKPAHIKNYLFVFLKSTISNPSFDSQCKETLTTPYSKFGSKPEVSDKLIEKLYKSGIVDKAISFSEISENKNMKKTDGKKKTTIRGLVKLDDANLAGTSRSKECTLILTEGDSAKTMAVSGLSEVGRDKFGVFPLRGKLLNVKDISTKKLIENEEITNLKKIIGLESGKDYKSIDELRYGRILIMTDQDVDGSHIKGLLFNMFETLWPSLVKHDNFLTTMLTPIIKVKSANSSSKDKESVSFYSVRDFERWREANDSKKWSIKYYKGLGTSTSEEAKEYFKSLKILNYKWTGKESKDSLDLAFNKKRADDRKQWLENYDKDALLNYNTPEVAYEDYINKDLIHFSKYDIERSIPNVCDGLKVSQRKIMFACFKRNFDKEMKVSQLAGYVGEQAAYHHGDASMYSTIVGLAQNYVGSNNINLLNPIGQFGTRIQGGKDAASPRYINTIPNKITYTLFKKEDSHVLNYLNDDGFPIEPEFYIPIIPLVLVNGAIGIGTGFSTNIPCFNPSDIVQKLKGILVDDSQSPSFDSFNNMKPWYNNFKGTIEVHSGKYYSRGRYERINNTKVRIKELPVGFWIEDFKELLESILENNKSAIKSYESHYTDKYVDFIVSFTNKEACDGYLVEDQQGFTKLESELKLISSKLLGIGNMYLFNSAGQIKKYEKVSDIVKEFYDVRLTYYTKRKNHILSVKQIEEKYLLARIRFILQIINNEIKINNIPKKTIVEQLSSLSYPTQDDDYDYLLRMPLYSLTMERKLELEKELANLISDIEYINSLTEKKWWLLELEQFEQSYVGHLALVKQ